MPATLWSSGALRKGLRHPASRYAFAALAVAVAFGVRKLVEPLTGTDTPFVLFFGAVLVTSLRAGHRPGILATLLSTLLVAHTFAVLPGHDAWRTVSQSILYLFDCGIVVYFSFLIRRAQRTAAHAQERLRRANAAARIGCWELDVAAGSLDWSTASLWPLGGGEAGPASLEQWLERLHPEDRDVFRREHARSLDPAGEGQIRCELRIGSADGGVRWISWVGQTSFDARAGSRVAQSQVGVAIDVTEQREREESIRSLAQELARSQAHLQSLIDLAPDPFFLADLEGRYTEVNRAACKLLGYERDELLGKTVADLIPPGDAARLAAQRSHLLASGDVLTNEWSLLRKDGSFVPTEISANILPDGRWEAFVRDISERRARDDERQVFVALLENSSDFIGIATTTGQPIYVNPAGRRMVGLAPDHPVEQTQILDYYTPEQRAFADDVIRAAVLEGGRWSGETSFRHWQSGAAIPVSEENFLIRDAKSGRTLGLGTVTRDISEARRAAEQLRESEERFRLALEGGPIGMALVGLDGRWLRVNRSLCEITGYPREELEQLTFQEITHPDDLDTDLALVGQLVRGEIPHYRLEKRYFRKDGETITIILHVSLMRDSDGTPLHFISQIEDVSEHKRAEQALRSSEARFAGIVAISTDAIISADEAQRITLFNASAARTFGYSSSEAIGQPLDLLLPERLRIVHHAHVAGFASGPVTARPMGEHRVNIVGRRRSGDEFPAQAAISKLEIEGRTLLTVAVRDVTEQRRGEREQRILAEAGKVLASSLDFEETLANVAQLAVRELADFCIVETVENGDRPGRRKVASADPARAALAAYLEQMADRSGPFVQPVLESRRPYLVERMTPLGLAAFGQSQQRQRVLREMGLRSVMGLPLLVHDQLLGALVLISSTPSRGYCSAELPFGQALAERVSLALEKGHLYHTALQATRLRDEVLSVVAHDLRNPLAVIRMCAASLPSGAELEGDSQRAKRAIELAVHEMGRLIQDLLDVSRIEARQLGVERVRLRVVPLLVEAAETQRELAKSASIEIRLKHEPGLPDVSADPHRLRQVFANLIGNAIRFTPPAGCITLGAMPGHGEVTLWVADTGSGIAPDHLPHIFDRFWQAHNRMNHSAGLGLSISRGIVEAHGGGMWAQSTLGQGTTFFFTLPQAASNEPPEEEPNSDNG